MKWTLALLLAANMTMAQGSNLIESKRAPRDTAADTDPSSDFWRGVPAIFAGNDSHGRPVPGYKMEVRSRWTGENLYFLFICPFEELYLKPNPTIDKETNQLWNWDVAEAFIGSDFKNIREYREFEVSPRGEWVDLAIDLDSPHHEDGWTWNSGFKVAARVDQAAKIWYACMRIPYASVDTRPAATGNTLRVNLYLSEGPRSNHKEIAWQPTGQATFHVPEAFGTLKLVD